MKSFLEKIKEVVLSLKKKEVPERKKLFILLGSLFLIVLIFLIGLIVFLNNTIQVPSYGGTYAEGMIGRPRFLNPVYSPGNDVDRDITELLFSGLAEYNKEGEIEPFLAESIEHEGYTSFRVTLRDDIYWSDGEEITARDVVFTVETIQNPAINSPLQINWIGVRTEKISEKEVVFFLEGPSPVFLDNLTLKIIPYHIWSEVSSQDFIFQKENLEPVGSGPFRYLFKRDEEERTKEIVLEINPYFIGKKPYLENISFKFYENKESLLEGRRRGEIEGFALSNMTHYPQLRGNDLKSYYFTLPRYFALFFNLNRLEDQKIREALLYATDKEEVLSLLNYNGKIINSPVMPDFYDMDPFYGSPYDIEKAIEKIEEAGYRRENGGYFKRVEEAEAFTFSEDLKEDSQGEEVRKLQECLINLEGDFFPQGEVTGYFDSDTKEAVNAFQEAFSEDILDPWGFEEGTGMVSRTTRAKLNEVCFFEEEDKTLSFSITTIDYSPLLEVAENIKSQWEEIGIRVDIKATDLQSLENQCIRDRDFEILLFGTAMRSVPNPLPLWHSSRIDFPGMNFTGYNSREADALLEKVATSKSKEDRERALNEFQKIIREDVPAIFLYSPYSVYFLDQSVMGVEEGKIINSSKRFLGVENWYKKTKRIWN